MKRASGGLGTGTLLLLYYRARQANSTIISKLYISVTIVGTRLLLSGFILLYLIDKHAQF